MSSRRATPPALIAVHSVGDPNLHTPNIDRLATEGLWFDGAVGGCPLSSPCRGSMLTGRYPHHAVPGHEYPLPDGMPTIAEPFNQAGYHTAYLGKWRIDGFKEADGRAGLHIIPRQRRGGFRKWIGYENNNAQWDCHVHGHDEPCGPRPHVPRPLRHRRARLDGRHRLLGSSHARTIADIR